jgi:hypothetical protein
LSSSSVRATGGASLLDLALVWFRDRRYASLLRFELCALVADVWLPLLEMPAAPVAHRVELLAALDQLTVIRLFADTSPRFVSPFGKQTNPPLSVARRIGAHAVRQHVYTWPGGNMPASTSDGRCKGDSVAVDFKIITFSGGGGRLFYVGLSCIEISHEFPEFVYFT